jgi:hypothetical protein
MLIRELRRLIDASDQALHLEFGHFAVRVVFRLVQARGPLARRHYSSLGIPGEITHERPRWFSDPCRRNAPLLAGGEVIQ